jgi:phage shock protein A
MSDEGKPEAEPQSATPPASPPVEPPDTGYTAGGVPTFESVREKIETRYGTSIGASELDAESPEGRTIEEQYDARQRAAAKRLEEIRESMRGDTPQNDDT